jgi:hypothetical protein
MKTVGRYNGFKQGKNADLGLVGYDTLGAVWGSAVSSNVEQMAVAGFSDSWRTADDAGSWKG